MTDRTPNLNPIGRSGIVQFGGVLHHESEDAAWKGTRRDKTILAMSNDPDIGAIVHGIEMMIRSVEFALEPADDSTAAKETRDFVQSCLEDMDGSWPGSALSAMLSYLTWGWWVGEQVFKVRGGPNNPDKSHRSRYDDGKIGWMKWSTRPQATRYSWDFDEYDDPIALIQRDPQTGLHFYIPLNRCIYLKYTNKTTSPEGWTPLRAAYAAWYFKKNIQVNEAIGIERDLAGIPLAYYPSDWDEQNPELMALREIVTNVRNDEQMGITLPSRFDEDGNQELKFELLSGGGTRMIDTDKIIRRYANEIVTVFLANVMRSGQDGIGSQALSQTMSSLFQQAITAHLDTIADAINTQAIPKLLGWNGIDHALAPKIVPGKIDNTNLSELGLYLIRLMNANLLSVTPELLKLVHGIAGLPVGQLPTQDEIDTERAEWMATKAAGGATLDPEVA